MFYAGYNIKCTDIAVFETEKEREEWVHDEFSVVERIPLSEDLVDLIADETRELHNDPLYGNVKWIFNQLNTR